MNAPGNQGGSDDRDNRKPDLKNIFKSGRFRFSIWYAIVAILMIMTVRQYTSQPEHTLYYSDFMRSVQKGQIHTAEISPDQITGRWAAPDSLEGISQYRVVRFEDHKELIDLLESHGVDYYGSLPSMWPRVLSWVIPMALLVGIWFIILRRMSGAAGGMMSIGKSKAKVYVEDETKVTFNDIAGIEEAEEEVREIVEFLKEPEKFKRLGGRIPKGALLLGPPGTGKTLLARAVAGEAGVPFFSLSGSDFVEMFVGVGASRVRDLFQQAKEKAPCIVFIDELDALGKTRGGNSLSGHDEREQTLNQLLVEMDGFDANANVIIMSATNRPETLDIALLRPGRFDRQIIVDRPDINGREAILKIHAKDVTLADDVDLHTLAARTPGMVGADLANVINEAALLAARNKHDSVRMSDLNEAVDRVTGGLERKSRVLNEKERKITAYHEAGHALVSECLEHTDPVHRISIIPRGVTSLGQTMYLPTEDRYLMSTEELEDRLAVTLGGRVAEEIVFEDVSTSAGQDFKRATRIAEHMVKDYGMSSLGLVSYGQQTTIMQQQMPDMGSLYSEQTAAEIDDEVRRIIGEHYERVRGLLSTHKDALHAISDALMEREHMDGREFRAMLREAGVPVTHRNGDGGNDSADEVSTGSHSSSSGDGDQSSDGS